MKTARMNLVIDGWPVIVENIKLSSARAGETEPQIEVDWRLDVNHDKFPDITKMSADDIAAIKNHVGEKVEEIVIRDLADVAAQDQIAREIKGQTE